MARAREVDNRNRSIGLFNRLAAKREDAPEATLVSPRHLRESQSGEIIANFQDIQVPPTVPVNFIVHRYFQDPEPLVVRRKYARMYVVHNNLITHQRFSPPSRALRRFFGILPGIPTIAASPSAKSLNSI